MPIDDRSARLLRANDGDVLVFTLPSDADWESVHVGIVELQQFYAAQGKQVRVIAVDSSIGVHVARGAQADELRAALQEATL